MTNESNVDWEAIAAEQALDIALLKSDLKDAQQSRRAGREGCDMLERELDSMAKDALRYRWLRRNPTYLGWEHDCPPEFIDANVDAAMQEKP